MNGGAEEELARAVIRQAWDDAFPTSQYVARSAADQPEAWRWLTAERGGWAKARADWCAIAGVCPDTLRLRAMARTAQYEGGIVTRTQSMVQRQRRQAEAARRRKGIAA